MKLFRRIGAAPVVVASLAVLVAVSGAGVKWG